MSSKYYDFWKNNIFKVFIRINTFRNAYDPTVK